MLEASVTIVVSDWMYLCEFVHNIDSYGCIMQTSAFQ